MIGKRDMQWSPTSVSWLSFVIMGLVVAGVGLTGTAHVIDYLHERLTAHGIEHNREIAERIHTLLSVDVGDDQDLSPDALRKMVATYGAFGFRVLLIDRTNNTLFSDSHSDRVIPVEISRSWLADIVRLDGLGRSFPLTEGAGRATADDGHPMLIWLENVDIGEGDDAAGRWLLGVASDQKNLTEFLGELHWHLDGVMLLTYVLIAFLGYFSMRSIGRAYERKLEAQVRERTLALGAAHEEVLAKTRLATIGQTAAVLAHEMRNPLASIKLALAALKRADSIPERVHRRVDLVLGEVDRLDGLLSETLDYVRPIKLSTSPVVLDHLLTRVIRQQRPLLETRGLSVHRQTCDECAALRLDEDKMHQVLLNLLKNAIEASPEGAEIGLQLYREEGVVVLEISNAGEPLDDETLERAFEPFYTTKPRGSGLGLGLVKRVVEEHGGTVVLANRGESGTRVTVRLPFDTHDL